ITAPEGRFHIIAQGQASEDRAVVAEIVRRGIRAVEVETEDFVGGALTRIILAVEGVNHVLTDALDRPRSVGGVAHVAVARAAVTNHGENMMVEVAVINRVGLHAGWWRSAEAEDGQVVVDGRTVEAGVVWVD